jgi:hypothetical protein
VSDIRDHKDLVVRDPDPVDPSAILDLPSEQEVVWPQRPPVIGSEHLQMVRDLRDSGVKGFPVLPLIAALV